MPALIDGPLDGTWTDLDLERVAFYIHGTEHIAIYVRWGDAQFHYELTCHESALLGVSEAAVEGLR